ncbi:hypothetical protein F4780DRAFT_776769 [Xylariomycetidae sp. FL0641]|nr:hypothetical protein F4780DRAFT_776769 [Xylariomycetidae sp. FL0641]
MANSVQSRPKSILKKPSSVDLRSSVPPLSPPSKKSTAFDHVARDMVTGDAVPRTPSTGSQYRARHKWYRQEAGKALLMAKVDCGVVDGLYIPAYRLFKRRRVLDVFPGG